jgi:hypothetical protein
MKKKITTILYVFAHQYRLKAKFGEMVRYLTEGEKAKILPYREIRLPNCRIIFKVATRENIAGYSFNKVHFEDVIPYKLESYIKNHLEP